MHHLRSTWLSRVVVTVLVAAMVPLLAVHMPERSQRSDEHAVWLRSHVSQQLSAPASSAVDRALDVAAKEAPHTLRAYTHVFAKTYEQLVASPDAPALPTLSALFKATDVEAATLFSHLRYRAMQGTPPAVLPRYQATPSAPVPTGSPRVAGTPPAPHVPLQAAAVSVLAPHDLSSHTWGHLLRTLWSAQPLGP